MIFITLETTEEKNLFDEIYGKYDDMLTKYAMSLTGNSSDAEDILQEAYYRIIKYFYRVEKVTEALRINFLMVIVKNVAKDFFAKRRKEIAADYLEEISEADIVNSTADVYDCDAEYIKEIISGMDEKYRDVITLRYTYGYPSAEIGKMLGISESNVNARLNRARNKIRVEWERGERE